MSNKNLPFNERNIKCILGLFNAMYKNKDFKISPEMDEALNAIVKKGEVPKEDIENL